MALATITPGTAPARPNLSGASLVLIGASTGGVDALTEVIGAFPEDCPPTLIVQHMPPDYLASFIGRLDRLAAPDVGGAEHGERLTRGAVRFAIRADAHLTLAADGSLAYQTGRPENGHRPSVDRLMASATPFARLAVGVILTGIGRDGADGLRALHDAGASTICQDEATSAVYGMPRAAAPAADRRLPLRRIAPAILEAAAAIDSRAASMEAHK